MKQLASALAFAGLLCSSGHAIAGRAPVLPQIDMPHPYYYREMYLPQLTGGPGSLAWSPDGRWVNYSAYGADAVELRVLYLQSGVTRALTANGAINLEARFSPDGRRIVFASSVAHKRFHLFIADFRDGVLSNLAQLTSCRSCTSNIRTTSNRRWLVACASYESPPRLPYRIQHRRRTSSRHGTVRSMRHLP